MSTFIQDVRKVTFHQASQFYIFRLAHGGAWTKTFGVWRELHEAHEYDAGSYMFTEYLAGQYITYHSSHVSVEDFEIHS